MDCQKLFVILAMFIAVNSKGLKVEDDGIVYGESMMEVVQRLVSDVNTLKSNVNTLKTENQNLKVDNKELKDQVSHLKSSNRNLQISVADHQWQSLHMAAAAACRASTPFGGYGPWANAVFVRTSGHTCYQVCINTKVYSECDASLSIMGFMGRVKTANRIAGLYYNYQCSSPGASDLQHEELTSDTAVLNYSSYYGYCCCRKP